MPARIFLIILFAAAARFLLVVNLPIRFLPYDLREDGLFIRLATNLASGVWLGDSNQFTVTNGPGYPLFLAATHLSRLPLSAAHALFQTAAILVTTWAIFRLTRSQWGAAATFIALSFCPVGLAVRRVLPEQIYWAQTLLGFSLLAILLFAPPRRRSCAMIVAGLAGLIFGWTWFTGEEGIWFLPAFALLTAGAVWIIRRSKDELVALALDLCVASAGFFVVNVAVLATNLNTVHVPTITSPQWASLPPILFAAAKTVWRPDLAMATPFCSVSIESSDFRRYWTFLNKPHVKTVEPNREVAAVGWYFDSQSVEWPDFKAFTQDGQEIPLSVTRQPSPDLQRYFSDDRAGNNRFQVKFGSPDVCAITAQTSDGPELRVLEPKENLYSATSGSALFSVDTVFDSAGGFFDSSEKLAAWASHSLMGLYDGLLPFLLPIGLIAAVAASWRAFSGQTFPAVLVMSLAAWLLAASRVVLLALINIGALPLATIHYSPPATYMAILAACLSLTVLSVGSRPE
jgi:hypothetical protein